MSWAITLWAQAAAAAWKAAVVWDVLACAGILVSVGVALWTILSPRPRTLTMASANSGRERAGKAPWAMLALATGLGLALRAHGRGVLPYWWDELLAVWMAEADLPTIVRSLFTPAAPASDFTPPLFYVLLHGWAAVFGVGEGQVRVMNILLSTAQIPLLGLLGRRLFSWRVGLAAAFLLSFSPVAIYYAQQVRCYALLGLLAVACASCATRAFESGRPKDMLLLGVVGTLFLYTHYVASWLWLGMGAATLLAAAGAAWVSDAAVARATAAGRCCAVVAGFGLAALCPFFDPPLLHDARAVWCVVLVAVLALGMVFCCPATFRKRRGVGFVASLVAAFAVPAVLLCLWMLPSGVVKVIGGPGARIPGSYGFAEFAGMLADFSGPQAVTEPSMLGLGLFLVLSGLYFALAEKPRQASLLLGWCAFPMAMAMAVQNPSMNLVRYLIATLPAVSLLVALALSGACSGLAVAVSCVRRAKPGRAAWLGLTAPALLGVALLGYRAYTATAFPATRANIEDYPAAAKRLGEFDGFFLASESQNLVRALSWYMERQGRTAVAYGPDSPSLAAVNVFLNGSYWHADTVDALGLARAKPLSGKFGEIALFEREPAVNTRGPILPGEGGLFSLQGEVLRDNAVRGRNVAFAGGNVGGLVPFYKKRQGQMVYRVRHAQAGPENVVVDIDGVVAGPTSRILVRVLDASGQLIGAVERRFDGLRPVAPAAGEAENRQGSTLLSNSAPPGDIEVEVSLEDDNSGVIYSSNVILRGVTLRFVRASTPGG